jgi:hypothetical protein
MAITKLSAHEAILVLLDVDTPSERRPLDEQGLGFTTALFGVLGRMIIPEDQKGWVISRLRVLGRDVPELAEVVEETILQIEEKDVV